MGDTVKKELDEKYIPYVAKGGLSDDWILVSNCQKYLKKVESAKTETTKEAAVKKCNASLIKLHDQYDKLFAKHFSKLLADCAEYGVAVNMSLDEFNNETWNSFLNAIKTVRFDDKRLIEKQSHWGFWICLNGYLRSASRDLRNKLMRTSFREIAMLEDKERDESDVKRPYVIPSVCSVEESILKENTQHLLKKAITVTLSQLNNMQVILFNGLENETPEYLIKRELKQNNIILSEDLFEKHMMLVKKRFELNLLKTFEVNKLSDVFTLF